MLVLTRRPGESVLIGDDIEILIVDVDWHSYEARCAISVCDDSGEELVLRPVRASPTQTRVEVAGQRRP